MTVHQLFADIIRSVYFHRRGRKKREWDTECGGGGGKGKGQCTIFSSVFLFFFFPSCLSWAFYKLQLVSLIKACYYCKTCLGKCELGTEAESRTVNAVIGG